ncbi:hypothetical protein LX15_002682 [Streptoalloteichus tenebrarius]|uniref:Secreted protein n=1 Tax=Streptoalloteichus tenebrarius (strain ATCC 17920 / DSM 40477 / JCM 4838 / CBS 697.72 / NBRC 16177 / NCIMB 11028 / NRRL B-12390 / A12253. 1 / ISP 5477) TaxID=1933 RepID=A0ABT1HU15_STRSD|nr:hypothetical protein [Streptoalloteichus tenebrarius]MCP2258983.1 hypothetical protein [Streptoalloteichus tenebrarius]BFF01192.1 hypothetical protein GCM10020241_28670 [Streptoalloteichus tenebrarius]
MTRMVRRGAGLLLGLAFLLPGCDVVGTPAGQGMALPPPPPVSPGATPSREREIYEALRAGDPRRAQELLDSGWQEMTTPRNVMLYQAAIAMASGDEERARRETQQMKQRFAMGTEGPTGEIDCNLVHALDKMPDSQITCEPQPPPKWPEGRRLDPRVAVTTSTPTTRRTTSPSRTTGPYPTGTTTTSAPSRPGTGPTPGKPTGMTGSR